MKAKQLEILILKYQVHRNKTDTAASANTIVIVNSIME